MRKLKFVQVKNPVLRKKSKRVTLVKLNTVELQSIIDELLNYFEECRKHINMMPVGLASCQVGIPKRIIVVDMAFGKNLGINDIRSFVNPKIIWHSKTKTTNRDGCMTLPNIGGIVSRYKEVRVSALDRFGTSHEIYAKGLLARLLQHEIDHLNGILFIDRLADSRKAHFISDEEVTEYRKKFRNWKRFIDVSNLVRKKLNK